MANWKWFSKAHQAMFRLSGGRVGAKLAGLDMVIIDTIGRKSGQVRSVPIACYPYKGDVTVVASNNGLDTDPNWWLNLKHTPEVNIQLGKERYRARAEEMLGEERDAFWPQIITINPKQDAHQKKSTRLLPIIRFRRVS